MDSINRFINSNPKYSKLSKPLNAARVCDTVRELGDDRFSVLKFTDGLLTLGVDNTMLAASLRLEEQNLIKTINQKIGGEEVKKIIYRII